MLAAAFCARAQYDIDQFFIRGQMALNEGQYLQAINNFNVPDLIRHFIRLIFSEESPSIT